MADNVHTIANSAADPPAAPGGAQLYAKAGGLFVRSSGGAITALAGGAASLTAPTIVQESFNTSTAGDLNLSSVATNDWLAFRGGYGNVSVWYFNGFNPASSNVEHKIGSKRLRDAVLFLYNGGAGNAVGFGKPLMSSNAADANTGVAMAGVGITVTLDGSNVGHGWGIDLPLADNESGSLVAAMSHHSCGVRIRASFSDGSATPIDQTVSNPDPGGGTRYLIRATLPFVNVKGGTRLRVWFTKVNVGTPFTSEIGPAFVYY